MKNIIPENMIELLKLDDIDWTVVERNAHGFKRKYYFDGINIHFDNPAFEGVWVEMSGQGCRAYDEFSSLDWLDLFEIILCKEISCNLTRLDVAYDDTDGILNLDKIYDDVYHQNYVSRCNSWEVHASNKGKTVYIGSMKSDLMFRVYDKASERNRTDEGHWIRFEIQLRDARAVDFVRKLAENSIGELFNGVLNNYLRFVVPNPKDSNNRRWKTQKWWTRFTEDAAKISLWTPCDTEYNLMKVEKHVYKQCGNGIHTLMQIKGNEQFYKDLIKNKPAIVSEKYQSLLAEYGKRADVP